MFDPETVKRIVDHMNEDHADANMLYIKAFTDIGACDSARMLGIDEQGMDFECVSSGEKNVTRVYFEPPLDNASQARERLVAMVKEARTKLDQC